MDAPREYGLDRDRRCGGRTRMVRSRLAFSFILAGAALSTACAAPNEGVGETRNAGSAHSFTEGDDGRTIELSTGDTFVIRLRATPGTGYSWAIEDPAPAELELLDEEFTADADAPVGGEEGHSLRFRAVEAGTAELRMVYRRPWEAGVEPLRTFSLDIEIED